ncbi:putative glucooligosaccharide oxidase [Hypoxylon sp. FL0890]|nr:putative glucooligosaccharide oxidase [Hypoxylon sp. FL0890]
MASIDFCSVIQQLINSGVPFKTSLDPDWTTYSSTYNIRLPVTPAVVIVPTSLRHIQEAILCAREHGLKVQARSGGHSYASYSNGGLNGAMIVDLRQLHDVNYHAYPIVVHAGARLGNMAREIYEGLNQKFALPHGTCAGVGVGGHFTHGGYGFFSRAWGLSMDRIVGISVITADGSCVIADKEQNQDLFYAMRGAADSFGIATSFILDPVSAPASVVHWSVQMSSATTNVKRAVRAFQYVQDFTRNGFVVDRWLGLNLTLASDYFAIGGTYLGPRANFESTILSALMEGLPEEATVEIKDLDWLSTLKLFNQDQDIRTSKEYSEHSNFFAKSVVVPDPGFTEEALTSFFTYLLDQGARAPVSYFILIDLYGGADSQISNKDLDFSAFAHRDALWVAQLYGYVDDDKVFPREGLDFVNGLANSMTQHLPRYGAYSNYTDPSLTREEAHKLYYGEELCKILKDLKQKWDPDNMFANPQSI